MRSLAPNTIPDLCRALLTNPSQAVVVITPQEEDVHVVQSQISSLLLDSGHSIISFPGFVQAGVFKYESARRKVCDRLAALWHWHQPGPKVMVTSALAFQRPTFSWQAFQSTTLSVLQGSELDQDVLLEALAARSYVKGPRVEEPGDLSVRGSIVDLWSPQHMHPLRIEFFGDRVESMRHFKAADQRSVSAVLNASILPVREFLWASSPDTLSVALEKFNHFALGNQILGRQRSDLLENISHGVPFPGIDDVFVTFAPDSAVEIPSQHWKNYSAVYLGSITEHLEVKTDAVKIYSNAGKSGLQMPFSALFPHWTEQNVESSFTASNQGLLGAGSPRSSVLACILPDNLQSLLAPLTTAKMTVRAHGLASLIDTKIISHLCIQSPHPDSLLEISGLIAPDFRFVSASLPAIAANILLGKSSPASAIVAFKGTVEEPFWIPESKSLVVSEAYIRGSHKKSIGPDLPGSQLTQAEASGQLKGKQAAERLMQAQFGEFTDGDLVVHVQHGIAKFIGLMTIKIMDITGDFLALQYAGGDKVYVPVQQFSLVQRYVGSAPDNPEALLDSLKGTGWEKRRQKAQIDAEKVAREMMDHQAKRATTAGHCFSPLDEDYHQFCAAFPYDETEDQLSASSDIMADMGTPKAMDRLLVGDVGFGKTEVAFRAAYRAVLDGKQVAWLVPTTVLSHQHHRSALERYKEFGVRIDILDRTAGTKSQAKILADIAEGKVDILIGTHRILSDDIKFKELGLLVVDEEQRFGVLQKERIKRMSYGIDVLTMTATPIPRTLQMAMLGLRDLSLLSTPPKARLAVKTFVCPFQEDVVKTAIDDELARGGQVFYVHNRVEELETVQEYLKGLHPGIRICVGHGQMSQKDLDIKIIEFLESKYDLLLCTTIIESGIDMPGVNTILVQNSENFGLAQLYQLRGRVGRRSTRGYAYFLTHPDMNEESDGAKRLEVLHRHQDLGSGFLIASHDLEMRGAGSLTGDEQTGKTSNVGLETYTQMLTEAIGSLGGIKIEAKKDVEIVIPISAHIPEDYVTNSKERLKIYRRFFGNRTEDSLHTLMSECEDRFGPPPEPVSNLSEIARLRRLLVTINARSLKVGPDATELKLPKDVLQGQGQSEDSEKLFRRILDVCNRHTSGARITPDGRLLFPVRLKQFQNGSNGFSELKRMLGLLAGEVGD